MASPYNVNGTLFFMGNDGVHGSEIWKSDGTEAGTQMIKDIRPGPLRGVHALISSGSAGYYKPQFANIDGTVFFRANDGTHGYELWSTNGTAAGTVLVKDIRPGPEYSYPVSATNVGGTLFFRANDGIHGHELWTAASLRILEDASTQTIDLTGIAAGPNESQNLTITATSDNPDVISDPTIDYTSANATGLLSFKPVSNKSGTAKITVTVTDDGGTADGGLDTFTRTFTVIVNPVNDAPSFTKGADRTTTATPQSISNWATAIVAGPPTATDEAGQHLSFTVANDRNDLFDAQPAIDPAGKLTFTPKFNVAGTAHVMVSLMDNGGTAAGGVDTSAEQTFNIVVTKAHVWHNDANPLDVTGEGGQPDGHIVAADALAIINYINAFGSGAVPANSQIGQPYGFLDTSGGIDDVGDDSIAPDDALAVINAINAGLGGEGESFAADMNAGSASSTNPQVYIGKHDDPTDLIALLALDMAQQNPPRKNPWR